MVLDYVASVLFYNPAAYLVDAFVHDAKAKKKTDLGLKLAMFFDDVHVVCDSIMTKKRWLRCVKAFRVTERMKERLLCK